MVMFGSAAVCLLTTDSLQYCLIVTSCSFTAVYYIKRRDTTSTASVMIHSTSWASSALLLPHLLQIQQLCSSSPSLQH